jgi:iron-sulfur cluster repair protein YtfE (RIC family)
MEPVYKDGFIEAMPAELLREPLVWFFAEHYRHRAACKRLRELARSVAFDEAALQDLLHFLNNDLPLHVIDEEDDLFPLLRRRCQADDQIEAVLGMLSGEHASDLHDAAAVRSLIATALTDCRGPAVYTEAAQLILPFCRSQERHIAVENAVVLPIARARLNEADLHNLGRRLAARRGLPDPFAGVS